MTQPAPAPSAPTFPQPDEQATAAAVRAALKQFRVWAADPRALVVDTETTSLDGQAWSFAGGRPGAPDVLLEITGEPETPWSEKALAMQPEGLRERLCGLPHPRTHCDAVAELLAQNTVLAYNESFDRPVIERTFDLADLPAFGCVALAYAPLAGQWSGSRGYWKTVTLDAACRAEGIDPTQAQAHTASGDVWLTGQLILAVARRAQP
ncbi:3'-5' exonuclease [Deinococcus aquaedulcis]|uniref:3'-5' exonuclease n=1 Tax=Deinococcus aquaedulcis TaxID=2840455 RepID=UPI001C8393D1|nr:hypothetical protein [Deinococcus aquaedulcis]